MNRLEGRVAIVTGAGRGIGKAVAELMAEEGAKVVVNDLGSNLDGSGISKQPAEEVVEGIKDKGGDAVSNADSVSEFNSSKQIINCALDNFGRLDILVNCAGILRDRMIFNMKEDEWLMYRNFGAYNEALACGFNGFDVPDTFYISQWQMNIRSNK